MARTSIWFTAGALVAGTALHAAPAHAADCGSTLDTASGADIAGAGWNVPRGAAAFVIDDEGPITAVLNAIGESRTHVLLSLGAGGAAQSTTRRPAQRDWRADGFCDAPIEPAELEQGYPGSTRIQAQAAYVQHFGVEHVDGGWRATNPPTHMFFQRARVIGRGFDTGVAIAETAESLPGEWVFGSAPDDTLPPMLFRYHLYSSFWPGPSPYSFHQYRDIQGVNYGAAGMNRGQVCSTFLSFLQHERFASGLPGPFDVVEHTYTHDQTVAAGHALYASVKGECQASIKWWALGLVTAGSLAWCADDDLCDDAAGQVRNCMSFGICDNGDVELFDDAAELQSFTATSISPDWLAGWVSGQAWWEFPNQSVWAWDGNHEVQWNSGGPVYACWT